MATWQFPAEFALWTTLLAEVLDARLGHRLPTMFLGLLFARGRRTISSWLRAVGIGEDYKAYYYFLGSLGRKCEAVASRLLRLVEKHLPPGERLLLALDDSPTKRYGPHVEGAGIHHNPTPGPADQKFLYGHVWVTLAWVRWHPLWGTIALPLLARLYVRRKDVLSLLCPLYDWKFRTKLELAAELIEWAARWLRYLNKSLWVVVDGAYAKRPFLRRATAANITVVSRLRKDAALRSVPVAPPVGQRRRGRPRIYGPERINLAKRAGQKRGWQSDEFVLYGRTVPKTFKTFLATYPPAGGLIRVVLVKEDEGWVAFFCTNPQASVTAILEAVADRAAIEQVFHDVKEVHGAGQPQLRHVWANVAAWHMTLWLYTLVELWAWNRPQSTICDRSASPWDTAPRRPSHADRCKALRRDSLEHELTRYTAHEHCSPKILRFIRCLARRAA
ncbi:MAG: transposase [Acidobacteria bacterium]|nr:transposase [Acidobacteriota bacterium]